MTSQISQRPAKGSESNIMEICSDLCAFCLWEKCILRRFSYFLWLHFLRLDDKMTKQSIFKLLPPALPSFAQHRCFPLQIEVTPQMGLPSAFKVKMKK